MNIMLERGNTYPCDQQSNLHRFENLLRETINQASIPSQTLKAAIEYALFPGGKRLRPSFIYACGHALSIPTAVLDSMAIAIELIHCYSLVHDDLPSMDNDDFRRGKPSCHREFSEATAILAGDGMQALATELLLKRLTPLLPAPVVIQIAIQLMNACGPSGMVSGQCLDLTELTHASLNIERLTQIHHLKTGQLFSACANMILACTMTDQTTAQALQNFATHFGLLFQMQDDYLDCFSGENTLGKFRASDQSNHKKTFASFYNQTELYALIQHHYTLAGQFIAHFNQRAEELLNLLFHLQTIVSAHAPSVKL